jgi:hypothetical protein
MIDVLNYSGDEETRRFLSANESDATPQSPATSTIRATKKRGDFCPPTNPMPRHNRLRLQLIPEVVARLRMIH